MITSGNWENFLTLEGEKLLFVIRKHVFMVVFPVLVTSILSAIFITFAFLLFINLAFSIPLFIATTLLILSAALSFISKEIVDWYFHVYILTNRKILELWYSPLTHHVTNDIMLDKVDCTEVDFKTDGWFNELIDMGNIVLTFDRPTHVEEFTLTDVKACDRLGSFLTRQLMDKSQSNKMHPIWFKERHAITI